MPRIIDLMEPTVKSGSGDAYMLCHFSSGYSEGLDMPEEKQSHSKRVSRLFLSFLNPFLENRHLRFELVDFTFRKRISLSLVSVSMAARRLRLRLRTLPEYWAAMMTALKINETAKVIVSRFLLSMRIISAPPKHVKNS